MQASLESALTLWLSSPSLTWGVGIYLAYNLGTWPIGIFLEWYLKHNSDAQLVAWKGGSGSRKKDIAKLQDTLPLSSQLWDADYGTVMTICGPVAMLVSLVTSRVLAVLAGMEWAPLTPARLLWQFVGMELVGDFGQYLGHRIQHEVPFLWQFHAVHHSIFTPTPLGTAYITFLDATFQATLPVLIAIVAVRAHPLAAYLHIVFRIGHNMANHSGLDNCWWLDLMFLKYSWLGRAKASHHDSHHQYGGRTGRPMNIGEGFWLWDWAFGTLSDRQMMRMDNKPAPARLEIVKPALTRMDTIQPAPEMMRINSMKPAQETRSKKVHFVKPIPAPPKKASMDIVKPAPVSPTNVALVDLAVPVTAPPKKASKNMMMRLKGGFIRLKKSAF